MFHIYPARHCNQMKLLEAIDKSSLISTYSVVILAEIVLRKLLSILFLTLSGCSHTSHSTFLLKDSSGLLDNWCQLTIINKLLFVVESRRLLPESDDLVVIDGPLGSPQVIVLPPVADSGESDIFRCTIPYVVGLSKRLSSLLSDIENFQICLYHLLKICNSFFKVNK